MGRRGVGEGRGGGTSKVHQARQLRPLIPLQCIICRMGVVGGTILAIRSPFL